MLKTNTAFYQTEVAKNSKTKKEKRLAKEREM